MTKKTKWIDPTAEQQDEVAKLALRAAFEVLCQGGIELDEGWGVQSVQPFVVAVTRALVRIGEVIADADAAFRREHASPGVHCGRHDQPWDQQRHILGSAVWAWLDDFRNPVEINDVSPYSRAGTQLVAFGQFVSLMTQVEALCELRTAIEGDEDYGWGARAGREALRILEKVPS